MEGQAPPVLNAQEPILNAQAPPVLNAQEPILNVQAPPLAAAAIPPPAIPSIIPYVPQPHGSPSAQFVRRMGFRMAAYSQLDLEGKFRDVSQRCIHLADSRQFAAVHVFAKEGSRLQNVKEAGYIAGLERVAKQVWGDCAFVVIACSSSHTFPGAHRRRPWRGGGCLAGGSSRVGYINARRGV